MENEAMEVLTQEAEEAYKSGSVQCMDSREVAEIMEKEHKNLLRDIARYYKELNQLNFEPIEFFMESTYRDNHGRKYKCYLVTKKGCEFIAHKLTGIKGTKFTATYINRFHEMEDKLKENELIEIRELANQVADLKMLFQGLQNSGIITKHTESRLPKAKMRTGKLLERPTPISEDWYERNRARIYTACVEYGVKYSDIYHSILKRCAEKYDLEAANEVYRQEVGSYPRYAMDIVSYFPELAEVADEFLDSIK